MRSLTGWRGSLIHIWLGGAALLHFYYAGWGYPDPWTLTTIHLALFLPAIFLLFPFKRVDTNIDETTNQESDQPTLIDWILAVTSIIPPLFAYLHPERIYERSLFIDPLTTLEVVLAFAMLFLVLEAVRRALSMALTILASIAVLYMYVAYLMPGIWNYREMPLSQIAETMYMMTDSGMFGMLTEISATIVATFLIFGAFLQRSGLGNLFINLGNLVAGRFSGGPAKVSVITSALFGSTSGSSVANVVVTGSVSIPMMKRLGFRSSTAAGIEASSSVGGLIMPPVMGAAAFVMAELIQVPYFEIISAALLGGLLYFFGIFVSVHFESKRLGIKPLSREEMPKWADILPDIHLAIPLALLVTMMAMRFTAFHAAFFSIIAIVVVSWFRRHTRMYPRDIIRAFVDAGATIAIIAVAVACAGIIMVAMTQTGLILAFGGIIKTIAGTSIIGIMLVLACVCLLLGMGVPTTPAYIITASIGTPILAGATDASMLQINLFIFYFAALADATPPVAAASYAAAAIAKANPLTAGAQAFRMATGGFLVGFNFIFSPGLIMNAPLLEIVITVLGLAAAISLFAIGTTGYITRSTGWPVRVICIAGGIFCALGFEILPIEGRALLATILLLTVLIWDRFGSQYSYAKP